MKKRIKNRNHDNEDKSESRGSIQLFYFHFFSYVCHIF